MKLLKIFPLVALMTGGLALGDGVVQGRGGGASSANGSVGLRGGAGSFRSPSSFTRTNQGAAGGLSSGRSFGGRSFPGGSQAVSVQRAQPVSRNGWGNWKHDDSRRDRDNNRDRDNDRDRNRSIGPTTFPQNFKNFGFDADYDTPYYRGGWRQTTSPFGLPATFVLQPTRRDFFDSFNGNDGGFDGRNGRFIDRDTTFPYFQGRVRGYQPFGTYGVNGPFTVPSGGVGTAAVQSALFQRGYYRGPVDGFAGELTREAIRNYQFQNGLPVTGQIDGYLLRSIRTSAGPWLR